MGDRSSEQPSTIGGGARTVWAGDALRQMSKVQHLTIAGGNSTYLGVRGEDVPADVDHEPGTGLCDLVFRDDLLDLLVGYRRAVDAAPPLPLLRDLAGVIRGGFPAQNDDRRIAFRTSATAGHEARPERHFPG